MNKLSSLRENEILSFIKDYFSILVIFPYFIGGLKQYYELSLMSTDLTKFFSWTQLLLDGIVTMVKLILVFFFVTAYKEIVKDKKLKLFNIILIIALIVIFTTTNYLNVILKKDMNFLNYILYLILFLLAGNFMTIFNKKLVVFPLYFVLIGFAVITVPGRALSNDIVNLKIAHNLIVKRYPKATFVYFNDQYLFFRIQEEGYIVQKIDDIFAEENEKKK